MNSYIFVGLSPRIKTRIINKLPEQKRVNPDFLDHVCDALDLEKKDLTSIRKTRDLTEAKFISVGIIMENPNHPNQSKIAKMLGRHRTTIIYQKRMYDNLIRVDKKFAEKVAMVKEYLKDYN